jgi:hypothetical protein
MSDYATPGAPRSSRKTQAELVSTTVNNVELVAHDFDAGFDQDFSELFDGRPGTCLINLRTNLAESTA